MSFRPYKFVVTPVVQSLNDEGEVVAEHAGEPIIVFGCAQLEELAHTFDEKLKALETPKEAT